jgi:adenylate kinase
MIYVFLGPPGSGKDTQIKFLQEFINLPKIATGDLFREAIASQTEIGKEAEAIYKAGNWPSDEMAYALVKERVSKGDCKNGFILNGYPRRIGQVMLLDQLIKERNEELKAVIHFDLDEAEVMKRLHAQLATQKNRGDSTEEAMRNRYLEHVTNVTPILEEYEKRGQLIRVDAKPSREEIFKDLAKKLDIQTKDGGQ